ncbi:MAG: hypothetical protein ACTH2O_04280, partial [Cellulosimicrobium funkei]
MSARPERSPRRRRAASAVVPLAIVTAAVVALGGCTAAGEPEAAPGSSAPSPTATEDAPGTRDEPSEETTPEVVDP